MLRPKKVDNSVYFILMRNIAEEGTIDVILKMGTIWLQEQRLTKNTVLVCKYEGEHCGILKHIEEFYLKELTYQEVHLLLGISDPISNRISVINDSAWMKEGLEITAGTVVEIYDVPDLPNGALGTVRFKGRLPGQNGTSFGVELHQVHKGRGTTNGVFRHKQLFHCDEDCGLFLSVFRIRLRRSIIGKGSAAMFHEKRQTADGTSDSPVLKDSFASVPDTTLEIDERVVWMSDFGPEFGTVKWIGFLPFSNDNKTVVGVEFDNAVGSGTGKYKGVQLFQAPRNHASLIPLLGLLRASVYMSMMSDSLTGTAGPDRKYGDFHISDSPDRSNQNSLDNLVEQAHLLTLKNSDGLDYKENIGNDATNRRVVPRGFGHSYNQYQKLSIEKDAIQNVPVNLGIEQKYIEGFSLDDRVKIVLGSERHGVIRWIGKFPGSTNPDRIIAGVEMDVADPLCYTSGDFQKQHIFDCPPNTALFVMLSKLTKV